MKVLAWIIHLLIVPRYFHWPLTLMLTSPEHICKPKKMIEYATLKNPKVIMENVKHFAFYESYVALSEKACSPYPIK